jgi:hypothetical protein
MNATMKRRWNKLTVDERTKIVRKAMPEAQWQSLVNRCAATNYEDMTPLQQGMVNELLGKEQQ